MKTLNEVYCARWMRRRYEVWFVRVGLADRSGAWWFRYLLMNPGRGGCVGNASGMPVQAWATWFPRDGKPQSFIQGFALEGLELSARNQSPFHLRIADNEISENSCRGDLAIDGHRISWDLQYSSTFRVTLSNKGWIGFSRSSHSDAVFSGKVTLDDQIFEGHPLGFGVQGHNCGYKHRSFWKWAHAYFSGEAQPASTLEALIYDMPLGLTFGKAVLWHDSKRYEFHGLKEIGKDPDQFVWSFRCSTKRGVTLEVEIDGKGSCVHRLPYLKTDCSGSLEVVNNSLAKAVMRLQFPGKPVEILETTSGAVLEMGGRSPQARS